MTDNSSQNSCDIDEHPFAYLAAMLLSISTEDAYLVKQTREYQEFGNIIQQLHGQCKTITNIRHRIYDDGNNSYETCIPFSRSQNYKQQKMSYMNNYNNSNSNNDSSLVLLSSSFIQIDAADEIVLKFLDFLDCQDLIRIMSTCTRIRNLVRRNVTERIKEFTVRRQLTSPMQLLRAHEQIHGVGTNISDPYVTIPVLLLSRRIIITDCGDPEYNGIYFCTGVNGNGFVFTKPRFIRGSSEQHNHDNVVRSDDDTEVTEPDQALRCIIARKFSRETILWYLSKELLQTEEPESDHSDAGENDDNGDVYQTYSFWAKLADVGDASPDVCRYPSQTSILRNDDPSLGWQSLTGTHLVQPPIVELLP